MAGRYAEPTDVSPVQELLKSKEKVLSAHDVASGRVHVLEQGGSILAAVALSVKLGNSPWPEHPLKDVDPKRKKEAFDDGLTGSIELRGQPTASFAKASTQQRFPWELIDDAAMEGTVFLSVTASATNPSGEEKVAEFLHGSAERILPEVATAAVQLAIDKHPPPTAGGTLRVPIRFALCVGKGILSQQHAESLFLHLTPLLSDFLKMSRRSQAFRFVTKSSGTTMWVYELTSQEDSLHSLFGGLLSSLEPPKNLPLARPSQSQPARSPRATITPSPVSPKPAPFPASNGGSGIKGTVSIPAAFRVGSTPTTSPSTRPALGTPPSGGSQVKPSPSTIKPSFAGGSFVKSAPPINTSGGIQVKPSPTSTTTKLATCPSLDPHRPTFFDLKDPAQLEHLRSLHATGVIRDYYDTIVQQMEGILQTRTPSHKLDENEMSAKKKALLWDTVGKGGSMAQFGNWVFFPWKAALIHLLPKDLYQDLRSNRNRYKISEEEQIKLREAVIAVAGLSAGGSIATTVAMEGIGHRYLLADFDHLEISNLNRLQASVLDLNVNKSFITARRLFEIDPYIEVEMFPEGVTTSNIDKFLKATLLFEECDSFDIKVVLRQKAKALRLPVIMLTSDSGLLDVERFDLEPTRPMFHGLVEGMDMESLARGEWHTKMAFVRKITDPDHISNRMFVSMVEIQRSISTWPQLASDVVLGGSIGAYVAKRVLLGTMRDSGRFYFDATKCIFDNNPANTLRQPAPPSKPIVRVHDPRPSPKDLGAIVSQLLGSPRPLLAVEQKLLTTLVRFAQAAPSGGNFQPWLFVHLRNLPENPTTNPGPRNVGQQQQQRLNFGLLACLNPDIPAMRSAPARLPDFISLGASVENIVIALQGSGLKAVVEFFDVLPEWIQSSASAVATSLKQPSTGKPDPLKRCGALITFVRATEAADPLSDAIFKRVSNRNNFGSGTPMKAEQMKVLHEALSEGQKLWGGGLSPSLSLTLRPNDSENEEALQRLAAYQGEMSRIRLLSPIMLADLQDELRWTEEDAARTRDGVDIPSLQFPEGADIVVHALREQSGMEVLRKINGATVFSDSEKLRVSRCSAIGMMSCSANDRAAHFFSGRAAQRLWLAATALKVGFQPMYSGIFVLDFFKAQLAAKAPVHGLMDEQRVKEMESHQQHFVGPAHSTHPHPVFVFGITDAPGPAQMSYRKPVSSCLKMPAL